MICKCVFSLIMLAFGEVGLETLLDSSHTSSALTLLANNKVQPVLLLQLSLHSIANLAQDILLHVLAQDPFKVFWQPLATQNLFMRLEGKEKIRKQGMP